MSYLLTEQLLLDVVRERASAGWVFDEVFDNRN